MHLNVNELAQLLRDAKDAHGEWEAQNGPDPDWPSWYAQFILEHELARKHSVLARAATVLQAHEV